MKNTLWVGLAMLGIGIGIGWFARSSMDGGKSLVGSPVDSHPVAAKAAEATPKPSSTTPSSESAGQVPPGKRALREPVVKRFSNRPSDEEMEQGRKMAGEMTKSMFGRQRTTLEQHLKRLEDALGLTAEQKQKMTTWLDERFKKLDGVDFTNPDSMKGLEDIMGGITTKQIDDELAKILTADQQTALNELSEKDLRMKVDSAALKNLAKIQGIVGFEEGQREEVYKILAAEAEENLRKKEEHPDPSALFTEGMGIEMDPYDLRIQQVMTETIMNMSKDGTAPDQKQIGGLMRAALDRRIDEKVERLRPVLNDKQLEQYRAELKAKGAGVYGTALMGTGATETSVDFVLPAK